MRMFVCRREDRKTLRMSGNTFGFHVADALEEGVFRCKIVYRWLRYENTRLLSNWDSKPVVMYFMRVKVRYHTWIIPVRNVKGGRAPPPLRFYQNVSLIKR